MLLAFIFFYNISWFFLSLQKTLSAKRISVSCLLCLQEALCSSCNNILAHFSLRQKKKGAGLWIVLVTYLGHVSQALFFFFFLHYFKVQKVGGFFSCKPVCCSVLLTFLMNTVILSKPARLKKLIQELTCLDTCYMPIIELSCLRQ